jgi:hypothetical protein
MKFYNIPIDICPRTYYNRIINSEVMNMKMKVKELASYLSEKIANGTEEEKTELLKIFARELSKLAAEGSKEANKILLEAAYYAAGMVKCPKCKGTGETEYIKMQKYIIDENHACSYKETDECVVCAGLGKVHKSKIEEAPKEFLPGKITISKPTTKEKGKTCPKCAGTGETDYIHIWYYAEDGAFAQTWDPEKDECFYCKGTGRI